MIEHMGKHWHCLLPESQVTLGPGFLVYLKLLESLWLPPGFSCQPILRFLPSDQWSDGVGQARFGDHPGSKIKPVATSHFSPAAHPMPPPCLMVLMPTRSDVCCISVTVAGASTIWWTEKGMVQRNAVGSLADCTVYSPHFWWYPSASSRETKGWRHKPSLRGRSCHTGRFKAN